MCVSTDLVRDKLDFAIMDITHQALDVALQSGFLDIDHDNPNYPREMLKSVDKQIMRSLMHAIMVWFAELKGRIPNHPIISIRFPRFL